MALSARMLTVVQVHELNIAQLKHCLQRLRVCTLYALPRLRLLDMIWRGLLG